MIDEASYCQLIKAVADLELSFASSIIYGDIEEGDGSSGLDFNYMVNHFKYWRAPDWPYPGTPCPGCLPAGLAPPRSAVEPVVSPALKAKGQIKSAD